uniref:DUF2269 family protein n=1 Tax=Solibacter usitatus (strain Ellin6076) TaxID=234267 RepID=Q01XH9_SOLUE
MTSYSVVLFAHIAAVMILFAAMMFEAFSLFHLRTASSHEDVRYWVDPVPGLPLAAGVSLLITVVSGIYLTIRMSASHEAWPKVTIGALFLIAPMAVVSARRMRSIRRLCANGLNSGMRQRLRDPLLKISVSVRSAVILGIVLLMGAKPELWPSVGIVVGSVVVGLAVPVLWPVRRGPGTAASCER